MFKYSRAPGFGINDNRVLRNGLLDCIFESRPKRGRGRRRSGGSNSSSCVPWCWWGIDEGSGGGKGFRNGDGESEELVDRWIRRFEGKSGGWESVWQCHNTHLELICSTCLSLLFSFLFFSFLLLYFFVSIQLYIHLLLPSLILSDTGNLFYPILYTNALNY